VTELLEAPVFHAAESYHQNYFVNHPLQSYCAFVVAPKVTKFRKVFTDKLRKK
jgi:peptide-methionine (S)-S-oxide reductase